MTEITAVCLFDGVGGFPLALQRAGVRVVLSCEIDHAARGVLVDHFNHVLHDDVRTLTADDCTAAGFDPRNGIFTAGFPCQDLSVAGGRAGLSGARSGLFFEIVRLADALRPRWLVLENVPGLLSSNGGRDMGIVVGSLVQLGYGLAWRVLDAQHFGVPQRRRRVVIVGCLGDRAAPVEILLEPESVRGDSPAGEGKTPRVAATLTAGNASRGVSAPGRRQEDDVNIVVVSALTSSHGGPDDNDAQAQHLVTHALTAEGHDASEDGTGRGTPLVPVSLAVASDFSSSEDVAQTVRSAHGQPGNVATTTAVRRLTPLECERLQGFPDDWTATSNGKPQADSPRYKQMGNAIAVPVFEWVARRLVALEARDGAA